jgi:hypothetical protein
MRYLAPATDVHDEVDLVTIPSIDKAEPAPRKSAVRKTRFLPEGGPGIIGCQARRTCTRGPAAAWRDQTDIDPKRRVSRNADDFPAGRGVCFGRGPTNSLRRPG